MPLPKPRLLRSAPASPFGRKVKIAAAILGLADAFESVVADTLSPTDPVRVDNPLGKIPTLVLDDGTSLYDSRVIIEYLDLLDGRSLLLPADPMMRLSALRLQALADGIAEAALLQIYESRFRGEDKRDAAWLSHQSAKVTRGLAYLEANIPVASATPHIGEIAVACALGYLDLRFSGAWRAQNPHMVAWLDQFAAGVPSFETTRIAV